jgi:glycosyltransferase involved in cell wall biosynthesis
MNGRRKVCIVAAAPSTVDAFLVPHILILSQQFDVTIVSNGVPAAAGNLQARFVEIPIVRQISWFTDLKALATLILLFHRERFDIVHSYTPKAGLLSMVAASVANVRRRLHTFTGQVWVTRVGLLRWILLSCDRITARAATEVLADSVSQLEFLRKNGIVSRHRGIVLANGSVSGVDLNRFSRNGGSRNRTRGELGISENGTVFIFLGRMNHDKGVLDLAHAFRVIALTRQDVYLLLVGPDEERMVEKIKALVGEIVDRIIVEPFTKAPEKYMQAADVICLPSYREGFGSVLIEAAACGLPCVASRIYGITDAVLDRVTGLLHPPGDITGLARAMERLTDDVPLRRWLSAQAYSRAMEKFQQSIVTGALADFYTAPAELET